MRLCFTCRLRKSKGFQIYYCATSMLLRTLLLLLLCLHIAYIDRSKSQPLQTTSIFPMVLKFRTRQNSLNRVLLASPTLRKYYRSTGISFNLRNNPQTSSTIPFSALLEPATNYPMQRMRVVIQPLHRVSFFIDIFDNNYITVGHLMSMIHQFLRQPISWKEWNYLSRRDQDRVTRVFFERCWLSSHPSYDVRQGVRRIDLLCSYIYFCGLVPDKARKGTWTLILGKVWCAYFVLYSQTGSRLS